MPAYITYRNSASAPIPTSDTEKNEPLSSIEIDGNFRGLKTLVNALEQKTANINNAEVHLATYTFLTDGIKKEFILGESVADENNTQVFINGIYQEKSAYNVSSNILSFGIAPVVGTIEISVFSSSQTTGGMSPSDKTAIDQLKQYAIFTSSNSKYLSLGNSQYEVTGWKNSINTSQITTDGTTFDLPIGVWQINFSIMIVGPVNNTSTAYVKNTTTNSIYLIGTPVDVIPDPGIYHLSNMSNGSSIIANDVNSSIQINIAAYSDFVPMNTILSHGHTVTFHKLA